MTSRTRKPRGAALRASLLASCVFALTCAAPAYAHGHGLPVTAASEAVEAVLGEEATPGGEGLIEINPERGKPVLTHGPDLRAYDGSQPGFRPGDPERSPACATDNYQRIIYAYPLGALPADAATEVAEIRAIVRRMNAVLNADSIASGGPSADYKVLCDGSGRIRVDTLATPDLDVGSIIDSVRAVAGLFDQRADYTVFLDAPNAGWCGIGTYVGDESPGAENANNAGGGYAVIERGCWNTTAPMHENGHNQGAVQYGAPSSTGLGAHCAVDYDVMCYSPDGGDLRQDGTSVECDDRIHFDCGFDDYFDSAPEPGEYLASHWNMGSPENRFIRFSQSAEPEPDPAVGVPGMDETAPVLVVTQRPWRALTTRTKLRRVRVAFSAYEKDATYRCRVDDGKWRGCGSPLVIRVARGRHIVRAQAIDAAGNPSTIKRVRFSVRRV